MSKRFAINNDDSAPLQIQITEYGLGLSSEDVVKKLNDYEDSRLSNKQKIAKYKEREDRYQRVIGGIMAYLELQLNNELWWDWNER